MSTHVDQHENRPPNSKEPQLTLTHFGAAGWKITDGKTTVLIDPYFSRLRTVRVFGTKFPPPSDDRRPVYDLEDALVSDTETIDKHIDSADYICISHSHFNHCMDMPYIANKTGATVIGTGSTINIARAYGVPRSQLRPVHGGEDYQFGDISIKAVPSLHSALIIPSPHSTWDNCHYFEDENIPSDLKAPLRLKDYVEGGTLGYLIRFGSKSVFVLCSMNYIEKEVEGLKPDIALIPSSQWRQQVYNYTERLMAALGNPPLVIATHWDAQSLPYGADQSPQLKEAHAFADEVKRISPTTTVVVPEHFAVVDG